MRRAISIFLFLFAIIVVIFFSLSLIFPVLNNIEQAASAFQLEQARKTKDKIVSTFLSLINATKRSADLLSYVNTAQQKALALDLIFKESRGLVKEVILLDKEGKEMFKMNEFGLLSLSSTDHSKEEGFGAVLKTGQNYFSRVFYSSDSKGNPQLFLLAPVESLLSPKEGITGVLKVLIDLDLISIFSKESKFGASGFVYITDSFGNAIAHPFLKGESLRSRNVVRKVLDQDEIVDGLEEGEVFVVGLPLAEFQLNWGIFAEQIASDAFSTQRRIIFLSVVFAGFIIILLFLLAYSFDTLMKSNILLKSERDKTKAIIFNFADGLIMYDSNNAILLINPSAETMLGIKAEEILNKKIKTELLKTEPRFRSLIHVLFPATAPFVRRIGAESEKKYPKMHEIILPPPNNLTLQTTTLPVYNPDQELIGFLKIIRDTTREKLIEKTKSEFISIAAHQLRTPMSAIKWIFRMLFDEDLGKLNSEQMDMVKKGNESTERTIELISDLLDAARIEEGRFGYEFKEANLIEIISSAIDSLQEEAKKSSVKIIFSSSQEKLPLVKVDVVNLSQAIQNLIDNAIRYNVKGGEVRISVARENNFLRVTVKDTGIGIPRDQLERIFSKFFRAENALRLQTEGSGLGLFIVRNIIKRHGGEIQVESEENKGATFSFTIPLKKELIPKEDQYAVE